ncbi:MAG: PAS domain-containing protein [Verrucomicrobia bacterium]|nr:PAS domain-containing protein [Verrucomicrobiota bacterium]MCH8511672.1 PAS domain-containing protein [Kiritimatiellia bacterium]
MKSGFLDQLLRRIDRIDPGSLQTHFLRLAREKGLLETILQTIREGLIVVDGKGKVSYANEAVARLIGGDADAMVGRGLEDAVPSLDWEGLMGLDPEAWTQMMNREIEVTYPEHRFLEFYVVPLQVVEGAEDDVEGALILLRDVTGDRARQESTVESKRLEAITLLAAGVAHEIGNPLNSLHIHMQLMERELKEIEDEDLRESLRELVEVSHNEISRLDQIIHSFLRALRPSQPQREPVRLENLLRDTLKSMEKEIEDRGVWVEQTLPPSVPILSLDKGQMQQAFYNLIRNAVQAMTDGGVLRIGIAVSAEEVAVSFRDSGSGIRPEDLGAVFEPFRTTKSEGTGLGLMIVQRIMQDHGGQIEIETRPGEGTTVTLLLSRNDQRVRLLGVSPTYTIPEEESE